MIGSLAMSQQLAIDPLLTSVIEVLLHRARNPLAGASATLQLLQSTLEEGELLSKIDTIHRELERVTATLVDGEALLVGETIPTFCELQQLIANVDSAAPTVQGDPNALRHIVSWLSDSDKVSVNCHIGGEEVVDIYIGHCAERELSDRFSGSLSLAAAQCYLQKVGGGLYWSGDENHPSPYTMRLKIMRNP